MEPREFICVDCHATVFAWSYAKDRCSVCQWIYDQPNLTEDEIEEIRVITDTPVYPNPVLETKNE